MLAVNPSQAARSLTGLFEKSFLKRLRPWLLVRLGDQTLKYLYLDVCLLGFHGYLLFFSECLARVCAKKWKLLTHFTVWGNSQRTGWETGEEKWWTNEEDSWWEVSEKTLTTFLSKNRLKRNSTFSAMQMWPRTTKPVLSVNFSKLRFIHNLKAE